LILTELQKQAIEKFKNKNYGALFMSVGTGKTITALELVKTKKDSDFMLYVTHNSLKNQVINEIEKTDLTIDYEITSYQSIVQSDNNYIRLIETLEDYRNVFIIADESTGLKNENKTAQRLLNLRKYCKYALIMTGTPITNDEFDLFNQIEFLSSKILKMNRYEFLSNFYDKVTYKKKGQQEKSFIKFSDVNRGYLQKIIDAVSIQGKLDIDFKIEIKNEFIEPSEKVAEEFGKSRLEFLENIANGNFGDAEILNFLMYANKTFSLDENKNKAVAAAAKNRNVVVFSVFREEQAQIAKYIGDECYIMNGDTSLDERAKILNKFYHSTDKPLLLTYGIGGLGLNLQTSNEIIFSSILFDWEKNEQAKGRIARIGQQSEKLTYRYILSDAKIIQMISKNLIRKDKVTTLVKEIINDKEI
jgi:superfamily II DNA or RNA helicase